jgi:hypothetical protein
MSAQRKVIAGLSRDEQSFIDRVSAILRERGDGWPYWEPRPAVLRAGTIGGSEWDFFSSIIEVRDRRAEGRS